MEIFKLSESLGFSEKLTSIHICDLSLLQRWLREVHNCHIYVEPCWKSEKESLNQDSEPDYIPWVIYTPVEEDEAPQYFSTYEEAMEFGLQEALIWIKEETL